MPAADKLVDIADFFGVSLDFLMRENSAPEVSFSPNSPISPKRPHKRRRTAAILLLSAAVFLGIVVLILYVTGAGALRGGSGITISGTGMLAALAVLLGAAGAVLFVTSIKK